MKRFTAPLAALFILLLTLTQTASSEIEIGSLTVFNAEKGQFGSFAFAADSEEDVEVMETVVLIEGDEIFTSLGFVNQEGDMVLGPVQVEFNKEIVIHDVLTIDKGSQKILTSSIDLKTGASGKFTIKIIRMKAKGLTFGEEVPVIGLPVSGPEVVIEEAKVFTTFNGPITRDVVKDTLDQDGFDFTLASPNNLEFDNVRFSIEFQGHFEDIRMWDVGSLAVLTRSLDITSENPNVSIITYTEVITLDADVPKKRLRVTFDPKSEGWIRFTLLPFQPGDVQNLDTGEPFDVAKIVPNVTIEGNIQTVVVPTLEVTLAAVPTSGTYARGAQGVRFVGITFRALHDDIVLHTVNAHFGALSGELLPSEISMIALFDGDTQISDRNALSQSLTASLDAVTELKIKSGETRIFIPQGEIDLNATPGDVYYSFLDSTNDIVATDSQGNSPLVTGAPINTDGLVSVTVADSGRMNIAGSSIRIEEGVQTPGSKGVNGGFFSVAVTMENMDLVDLVARIKGDQIVESIEFYDVDNQTRGPTAHVITAGDNKGKAFFDNLIWGFLKNRIYNFQIKVNLIPNLTGNCSIELLEGTARGATQKVDVTGLPVGGEEIVVTETVPSPPPSGFPLITIPDVIGHPGETVTIDFNIGSMAGSPILVQSVDLGVKFVLAEGSELGFSFVGGEIKEVDGTFNLVNFILPDEIHVSWATNAEEPIELAGTLASATFEVSDTGPRAVDFEILNLSLNDGTVVPEVIKGQIRIEKVVPIVTGPEVLMLGESGTYTATQVDNPGWWIGIPQFAKYVILEENVDNPNEVKLHTVPQPEDGSWLQNGDYMIKGENKPYRPIIVYAYDSIKDEVGGQLVEIYVSRGDVNGDGKFVIIWDLFPVIRHVAKVQLLNNGQKWTADVAPPYGEVTSFDAAHILASILEADYEGFPIDQEGAGEEVKAAPSPAEMEKMIEKFRQEYPGVMERVEEMMDEIRKESNPKLNMILDLPGQTELLVNYPNPFNPETWIPYRLAEDAFVTLTIYNGRGTTVRTIQVGHQPAAVYESKDKAIYWDGRNDSGEHIASGMYFYNLRTNKFTATRKMIIIK